MDGKENNAALRRADLIFGVLLTAASVFFFVQSVKLMKLTLSKNAEWYLSAGLVPMLVSALLFLCSMILIINALGSKVSFSASKEDALSFLRSRKFISTAFIIVWFASYIFLFLNFLDYIPATLIFLIGFIAAFSEKDLKKILVGVVVSVVVTVVIYYCFGRLVGIPLP